MQIIHSINRREGDAKGKSIEPHYLTNGFEYLVGTENGLKQFTPIQRHEYDNFIHFRGTSDGKSSHLIFAKGNGGGIILSEGDKLLNKKASSFTKQSHDHRRTDDHFEALADLHARMSDGLNLAEISGLVDKITMRRQLALAYYVPITHRPLFARYENRIKLAIAAAVLVHPDIKVLKAKERKIAEKKNPVPALVTVSGMLRQLVPSKEPREIQENVAKIIMKSIGLKWTDHPELLANYWEMEKDHVLNKVALAYK
jgi:hypothetical protein